MAVRYADCTRRQHRNREASETRYAQTADASLSDFGTDDVSPSNGISLQRQRQRPLQKQLQLQLSLRGTSRTTATASVATRNVKDNSNGNCRCAERQGQPQPQRSLRGYPARTVPAQRGTCAKG